MSSWGLIRVSVADIRKEPDQRSEQVTQAIMGMAVTILDHRGQWFQVRLPDGYKGWIHSGLLQQGDEQLHRRWSQNIRVLITVPWTFVYSQRTRHCIPVSDVIIGTELSLLAEEPRWYHVALPDGREGWVARQDTTNRANLIHLAGGTPQDILRTAHSFSGLPYLWGGVTPKGFDCSGLVQTVFRLNGVPLPRDAWQQFRCGRAVCDRKDLAPADLLFFQGPGADRITHVAIHKAGEQFIHCSNYVKINSLNRSDTCYDASLEAQYVSAKRIMGGVNGTC